MNQLHTVYLPCPYCTVLHTRTLPVPDLDTRMYAGEQCCVCRKFSVLVCSNIELDIRTKILPLSEPYNDILLGMNVEGFPYSFVIRDGLIVAEREAVEVEMTVYVRAAVRSAVLAVAAYEDDSYVAADDDSYVEADDAIPQNLEPVKVTLTPKMYKERVVSEMNNKTYRSVHGTDELECCICLEGFKKGCTIHRTSCYHHFHPKCLGRYLKKECLTPTCPMCRKDIREK